MKKVSIIAVLMILTLMTSLLTACGGGNGTDNPASYADSLELMNNIWSAYDEADMFPVGGGDSTNPVMDGPGKFDVKNSAELDSTLAIPESQAANIDDAASMMHMMNANLFTAGAYGLVEGADVETFAQDVQNNIDSRHWLCGAPEKFVIISSDSYVMVAFGSTQNIDTFKEKAEEVLGSVTVVTEEKIEG